MIEFNKTAIGFKSTPLVLIDSLKLDKGQLYILIGKNGSGKSTLLNAIVGIQDLLSGSILIDKKNIQSVSRRVLSKKISLVKPTFPQTDYLTVREFISLGRSPYTNALGRLRKTDNDIISKSLEILNITSLGNKFTSELSDGERQLVSIAKAIAQDTSVILLDEPTAFLDYSNKLLLHQTLKRIAKETNKCIILSSHDLELSIDTACDFLAINTKTSELTTLNSPVSKQDLLDIAFDSKI
ncbi:MAG: ABC transporter ATP-binding protein [Crocinitomicaceae bacterium]|nr:ABC transporter ATP-binding protein [Crocinitomicaceae bacterium]MDG1776109.1 ABC transporter ATP-binding protein [Crocinitomicaceae bacterium]